MLSTNMQYIAFVAAFFFVYVKGYARQAAHHFVAGCPYDNLVNRYRKCYFRIFYAYLKKKKKKKKKNVKEIKSVS